MNMREVKRFHISLRNEKLASPFQCGDRPTLDVISESESLKSFGKVCKIGILSLDPKHRYSNEAGGVHKSFMMISN